MADHGDICFEDPRSVLKRHGFVPKHAWGQNFLVSQKAVASIAEACNAVSPSFVVEIGAGVGTLTGALLQKHLRVTAVERDRDMCAVLRADMGDREDFTLLEADAAKVCYRDLFANRRGVLAGNLPYQITGKLLRAAVESSDRLLRAVFMVQEEVGERLVALPRTSARGALSVIVQARFNVRVLLRLKPTAFHPPPKVRSSVIILDPLAETAFLDPVTPRLFDAVVNGAFSSRRKTIRNSLSTSRLGISIPMIEALLEGAAVDPRLRPEELGVQDFARLARKIAESGCVALEEED